MPRLAFTIAIVAIAWSVSSVGYFQLLPVLDAKIGYNDAPVFFAAYYSVWTILVVAIFRNSFLSWTKLDQPKLYVALISAMAIAFASYTLLVVPQLPETVWTRTQTPVEFFYATSWYFIPKSMEILFQQILIAALILALNSYQMSLRQISIAVAALFGGFHLTLAISYDNPVYVLRYTVAATLFGAVVPYLILRMRNGFLLSYAVHWCYYALDIAVVHFVFAAD